MLMRTDPFRVDRLTQQVFGTAARPALMAMDAWQDHDQLILGDSLKTDHITANYRKGVIRLAIGVAERAKPRNITVNTTVDQRVITS